MTELISSTANPRVKGLVRLRTRRERDATGQFLVEGYRECHRAMQSDIAIQSLFFCPELYLGKNEEDVVRGVEASGAVTIELSEPAFSKAAYRDRPEGLLAIADQFDTGLQHLDLASAQLLLVAEQIEKPGNLGTMLRTADVAGVDAVIAADPTTDPFNPNVVRASLGCLFTVPLAVADTATAMSALEAAGISIVATTPEAERLIWDVDLTGPSAIVVGAEQYGLSDAWLRQPSIRARIPMAGHANSLNAAMATGIALFEAVRQRQQATGNRQQ